MNIAVNQVGYRPEMVKRATMRIGDTVSISDSYDTKNVCSLSEKDYGETYILDANTKEKIYKITSCRVKESEYASEVCVELDFTEFKADGKYILSNDKYGESYPFEIGKNVYDSLLKDVMRMFYLQRCGCRLEEKYAGKYAHKECHNTKARIYGTDDFIDVTGGWHDAGDYGRYIVAAAKAVVDLMMAYEYYTDIFEKDIDIPESGNGIPDILDEVRYELKWMLKMQREDGAVYHKVTCAGFPGFIMPELETEELIVSPVSDAATADFAASMAHAYRVYSNLSKRYGEVAKEYEKDALEYLEAAKKAMSFLDNNSAGEFLNPDGIVTGEYGNDQTIDEMFWAAAEMFNATGEEKYEEKLKAINLDEVPGELSWKEVGDYGFMAYLSAAAKDEDLEKSVYKRLKEEAEEKLVKVSKDPYGSSIYGYYYWGCNMEMANDAIRGAFLDRYENNNSNHNYELSQMQLSYLLGNNPLGKSFITGHGSNSPINPHHRPSAAMKEAMPGMLVGGPEPLLLDDIAKKMLKDIPPAKCYLDELDSYSTNEITIYWNSPFVFLLASIISK